MASCGEVDHSASLLASRKGGSDSLPGSGGSSPSLPVPECAICLQSCVHPVRLPCRHIFCFLCVKGASWQSKRCALCRQEVPEDFLERPTLLSPEELKASAAGKAPGEYAWYYEGRNGWWQYDERTSRELEDAFAKGKKTAEMLIAGFLYVADLENMVQYRRNEHGRRRKMKRDVVDIPKKGVAGLRLDSDAVAQPVAASAATGGRESSADGADTSGVPGTSTAGATAAPVLVPPGRPPTSLGGQPTSPSGHSSSSSDDGLSLDRAFVHLRIGRSPAPERGGVLEGEEDDDEDDDEDETSPSHMSSSHDTAVDESVPESSTEDEEEDEQRPPEEDEEEEEEEDAAASAMVAAWPRQRLHRPRPNPEERSPPGGASSAASGGSSLGSRRPDGQCTVTEV
ncbi:E3 ubiquitin-protein ligase rnf146 [Clupea harengus]|uniref:E3 ubiquitin-protein ligase n=1 Tax=Clupea harengus TaxID=7950 RepID=A0A6P3W9C3_CLUHA|nr:E3 ubiquitin-protein ligase rnf146 [Clupea harengus]XP_042565094.1 E3 ubiquitin-protein ligase rnf146 [Clupea harengus]